MWRVLSKLKFAKNRLRSSIGQELLEAMLVCSTETDLLRSIPNDRIYEKLAEQSTEMKRLLMFKTYSLDCRLQSHHILIVVVTVIWLWQKLWKCVNMFVIRVILLRIINWIGDLQSCTQYSYSWMTIYGVEVVGTLFFRVNFELSLGHVSFKSIM